MWSINYSINKVDLISPIRARFLEKLRFLTIPVSVSLQRLVGAVARVSRS